MLNRPRPEYLNYAEPDELMRQFLLQIRQQPQLTFVSMGMPDGQYYAGSRPPFGIDKDLRMLRARIVDNRAMEVFRVNEANSTWRTHIAQRHPFRRTDPTLVQVCHVEWRYGLVCALPVHD